MNLDEIRDQDGKLPACAWPGGYPMYYFDSEGNTLCPDCANKPGYSTDPVAYDVNWEDADLPIKTMTKRPKAQRDATGRFLPNGRRAKAGLNRAILASAWGQVVAFTRYKALRHGKLVSRSRSPIVRRNVLSAHSLPRTIG